MNEKFMKQALKEAKKALTINETPIGAVIVKDGKIISRGYNKRETKNNSLCHAEIIAINKACKKIGDWRLEDLELYVTLEPCPMCAGAIIQSRIKKVYFGAYDYKSGAAGSKINLFEENLFNHNVKVDGGVLEKECSYILKEFFRDLRKRKKEEEK